MHLCASKGHNASKLNSFHFGRLRRRGSISHGTQKGSSYSTDSEKRKKHIRIKYLITLMDMALTNEIGLLVVEHNLVNDNRQIDLALLEKKNLQFEAHVPTV